MEKGLKELAILSFLEGKDGGGGDTPSGTKEISITSNGTTTHNVESYKNAKIIANVPNSYAASDEGKVVSDGELVEQDSETVYENGSYDTTFIDTLEVEVPMPEGTTEIYITENGTITENVYDAEYVEITVNVSGGSPSGTKQISISQNGTTTENVASYASAQITVSVPNTYAAGDEGKVVSNGALVSQGSDTVAQNGTVDTTLISSLTVNVSGGGGSPDYIEKLMNAESFAYENNTITRVKSGALQGGAKNLTSLKIPNCTYLEANCLSGIGCTVLALPALTGVDGYSHLSGGSLQTLDLGSNFSQIKNMMIQNSYSLSTLILRRSSGIVSIDNTNELNSNAFKSGGSGGTVYIPKALYDHLGDGTAYDYQSATNWATVHGYGTITWAQIEGSIYETQYADGTTIPTT